MVTGSTGQRVPTFELVIFAYSKSETVSVYAHSAENDPEEWIRSRDALVQILRSDGGRVFPVPRSHPALFFSFSRVSLEAGSCCGGRPAGETLALRRMDEAKEVSGNGQGCGPRSPRRRN